MCCRSCPSSSWDGLCPTRAPSVPPQALLQRMNSIPKSPKHGGGAASPPPPSFSLLSGDEEDGGGGPGVSTEADAAAATAGGHRKGARTTLLIPIRAGYDGEMPFLGNAAPNAVLHPYSGASPTPLHSLPTRGVTPRLARRLPCVVQWRAWQRPRRKWTSLGSSRRRRRRCGPVPSAPNPAPADTPFHRTYRPASPQTAAQRWGRPRRRCWRPRRGALTRC